ncbi:hypothetical protein Aduo_001608 [Ancylostoma duodenale]
MKRQRLESADFNLLSGLATAVPLFFDQKSNGHSSSDGPESSKRSKPPRMQTVASLKSWGCAARVATTNRGDADASGAASSRRLAHVRCDCDYELAIHARMMG